MSCSYSPALKILSVFWKLNYNVSRCGSLSSSYLKFTVHLGCLYSYLLLNLLHFQSLLSSNILSAPFSSPSQTSQHVHWSAWWVSHGPHRLCSLQSFLFLLLRLSYFHCSVFKFATSAFESLWWIFHLLLYFSATEFLFGFSGCLSHYDPCIWFYYHSLDFLHIFFGFREHLWHSLKVFV